VSNKVQTQLEIELNRVKEIVINETMRRMANDDYDRGISSCTMEEYINSSKEELVAAYPDVNWGTLKYGPDMR